MRGLNRVPVAVNHPWVQVFLTFGGSVVLILLALWLRNSVWHRLPIWSGPTAAAALIVVLFAEGAFGEWDEAEARATALQQKQRPAFTVHVEKTFRVTVDKAWSYLVFQVHNNGTEMIRGCFVKIVSFDCTFSATPIGVREAPGRRFKWTNIDDSTCAIPGNSDEYVSIAFRTTSNAEQWMLHTHPVAQQAFPMPPGTFELVMEACGENVPSETTKWTISYRPDSLWRVEQMSYP